MVGKVAANGINGLPVSILKKPKQRVSSLKEKVSQRIVIRFLKRYISTGSVILKEDRGAVFTFEGSIEKCPLTVTLRIHNPQFYWKIMTQADFGLADAYISDDISFPDKDYGLENLFEILIANRDLHTSVSKSTLKRGWWSPMLFTALISSATYYFKHVFRKNTLAQARRNISCHYDLSNKLFSEFLDETMTYSGAILKTAAEDLYSAQMRKISLLIQKARIEKHHHVLEIGCGWGSVAVEVVRQTGCNYTGITLSNEQLNYAEMRAKKLGLQDRMKFLLIDYRQLPPGTVYDRNISCEMIECISHGYIKEYFSCVESALAEDGLLVLQFTSMPDQRYEETRLTSGFIAEFIFPGGCIPSLTKITTSMGSASNLCVEHLENNGISYYQTLRCWRKNFLEKQSKIKELGFDEKFIRTWEYYFDYCASAFKTRTLASYQVVFSRPGNKSAFSNPYETFPPTTTI